MKLTLVAFVLIIGINIVLAEDSTRSSLDLEYFKTHPKRGAEKNEDKSVPETKESSKVSLNPRNKETYNDDKDHSLQCYECTNCAVVGNQTFKNTAFCSEYEDQFTLVSSKCVYYARQFSDQKTPVIYRGCSPQLGRCEDIKKKKSFKNSELLWCKECDSDYCNGAFNTKHSITLFAVILIPMSFIHFF